MWRIKFNKLNGIDYTVIILLLLLMIVQLWEKYPELKGSFGGDLIKYNTTDGVIYSSGTRVTLGRFISSERYDIVYDFVVQDVKYRSDLITFSVNYYDIKEYLKKYPVGKKVTVYYQENNPSFSVLEPHDKAYLKPLKPVLWLCFLIPYLIVNKKVVFYK